MSVPPDEALMRLESLEAIAAKRLGKYIDRPHSSMGHGSRGKEQLSDVFTRDHVFSSDSKRQKERERQEQEQGTHLTC